MCIKQQNGKNNNLNNNSESDSHAGCYLSTGNGPEEPKKIAGGVINKRKSQNYPNNSIAENS